MTSYDTLIWVSDADIYFQQVTKLMTNYDTYLGFRIQMLIVPSFIVRFNYI